MLAFAAGLHDRRGVDRHLSRGAGARGPQRRRSWRSGATCAVHLTQHVIGTHFHFGEETHHVSRAVSVAALVGLLLHTFVDGVAIASGFDVGGAVGALVFVAGYCCTRCPKGWRSRACSSPRGRAAGARCWPRRRSAWRRSPASLLTSDVARAARSRPGAGGGRDAVRRRVEPRPGVPRARRVAPVRGVPRRDAALYFVARMLGRRVSMRGSPRARERRVRRPVAVRGGRSAAAARGAHASAHARRVRRPAAPARAGQAAARERSKKGTRRLDGLLGTARHRQDDARATHRALHRPRVRLRSPR